MDDALLFFQKNKLSFAVSYVRDLAGDLVASPGMTPPSPVLLS
jgi:hypothetical protein